MSQQLNEMSNNSKTDSEISLSVFHVRSSDEESTPANDMSSKAHGDKVIIEDWKSDDEDDVSEVQLVSPVKTNEIQTVKPRVDKIGQTFQKQGIGFKKIKACFVCKSTDHLIKDCVATRTGLHRPSINTARPVSTARLSINTARLVSIVRPSITIAMPSVSIARPSVSTTRPVHATRPTYPRVQNMTAARTRGAVNTGKGKLDTDLKKSRWVWRPKGNYLDHVSKDSGSFMLKKVEYVDLKGISMSVTGSCYRIMQGNPEILLQDHAVVDSGCSSHMTGNKAYLSDYEDFNGGFVAFGSDPKRGKITGKGKIKTANLDFDDVYFVDERKFNLFSVSQMCDKKICVLFTKSECLILSPSFKLLDESQVVLRAPRKDDVWVKAAFSPLVS
ncbi:hypothetical protein Tco_0815584 [Tanacetum coccineum]